MILAVRGAARLRQPISDVFRHGKSHATDHPSEKPVGLMRELIHATTVNGEAVLDPFSGSGSTVVAARAAGRRPVGIEREPRWYHEALQRLI
jgi:DNA modification methylase